MLARLFNSDLGAVTLLGAVLQFSYSALKHLLFSVYMFMYVHDFSTI